MTDAIWDQKLPSLREIKRVIPAHLFVPNHTRSFLLISQTVLLLLALFAFAYYVIPILPTPLSEFSWLVYWFFQGTVFWSIFGWGHDSGHGGVSKHQWINTVVGTLAHSFILLPYESWRISHKEHHRFTGNIDKDVNYTPKRDYKAVERHGLIGLLGIAQLLYIVGISGSGINHLNPFHPVFKGNRIKVSISLIICALFFSAVIYSCFIFGFSTVMAYYGMPLLGYGTYLILSSFLNHVDPKVPWWGDKEWTYMKGNIFSVIDISYGRLIDYLVQDNGLHQIHHLFPSVPTYHMKEATKYFRKEFPHLSKDRDVGVCKGFWVYLVNFTRQRRLPDDIGVFFYDGVNPEKDNLSVQNNLK